MKIILLEMKIIMKKKKKLMMKKLNKYLNILYLNTFPKIKDIVKK